MRTTLHGLATMLAGLLALPVAAQPYAYVPNYSSNDVSVIDTATDTVVTTIEGVTCANGVAVHAATHRAYVTNFCQGQLEVIDTSSNTLLAPLATNGHQPNAVAVNAAGTLAFVANESDGDGNANGELAIIDLGTGSVLAEIPLGYLVFGGVAVHPDGNTVYVTSKCVDNSCSGPGIISAISITAPYTRIDRPAGLAAVGVAISPDGSKVYVASHQNPFNASQGLLSMLDTATLAISHAPTSGQTAYGVAVHHGNGHVYVSNFGSNSVSVFDGDSLALLATVAVGANPIGLDVHPDGGRVYAANYGSNNVSVIDSASNTVAGTVSVGSLPHAFGRFIQAPATDITGTVTTSSGIAMSGITIISGALSTTTNASGVYSFTNLANGSYTVAPSAYNYTFAPTSRTVTLSGVDATAQDFVGTYNAIPDITDLRAMVVAANPSDIKSLLARLDAARDSLNSGKPNRVEHACGDLDKFIALVRKYLGANHPWVAAANDIQVLSGCPAS